MSEETSHGSKANISFTKCVLRWSGHLLQPSEDPCTACGSNISRSKRIFTGAKSIPRHSEVDCCCAKFVLSL